MAHGKMLNFTSHQGIKIKTMMREHCTPTRTPKIKALTTSSVGEDVEPRELLDEAVGKVKWFSHSPRYLPSREQCVHAETWLVIAALFVIAKNWRVTGCLSTSWWINQLWSNHTM